MAARDERSIELDSIADEPTRPLPPLVILNNEAPDHPGRIKGFLSEGMVVVIAPNPASARAWFASAVDRTFEASREQTVVRNGGLEIDLAAHEVRWGGRTVPVTKFEFRILAMLADDFGRAWNFGELMTAAWGSASYGDFAPLKSVVKRLRRKLHVAGVDFEVESVRGVGYRLTESV